MNKCLQTQCPVYLLHGFPNICTANKLLIVGMLGDLEYLIFSLTGSVVKYPPSVQETRIRSMSQEDPPEKEIATHSSILVWETPCTGEPVSYTPWGCKRVENDWVNKQQYSAALTKFLEVHIKTVHIILHTGMWKIIKKRERLISLVPSAILDPT